MKLHLPMGLRAALIAALTVIAFTLPQTGAATTNGYNIIVFGEDEVSWADYRIDLDGLDNASLPKGAALGDSGVTYTFEISGGKIWSHGADHTISVPDTWTADAITTMNTDMGTSLTTTDLNGLHFIASAAGSSTTKFILNGSAGTGTAKIANGDTITLYIGITGTYDKAPVNYNITGLEDATIMYATADADFSSTPQFTANARTLTLLQVTGTVSDATAISMYPTNVNNEKTGLAFVAYHSVKGEATDYIWSATGTSANWNDAVWTVGTATGQTIPDNAVAIFDTTATAKTVNFTEPETAKRITVSDNYTFAFAEGSGLSATRLTIDAGKTLTVGGPVTMEIGTLDNFGTLNLADADTRMTVANNFSIAAGSTFTTAGSGTLAVNTFAVSGGTVTIGSNIEIVGGAPGTGANPRKQGLYITNGASQVKLLGALTNITGAMYANAGTVTVGDGENAARVETNRIEFGDLQGSAISTLNILKGATVHVKGEDNTDFGTTGMLFGEWDASSVANISGKLYGDNTTAYVGDKQATINIENGGVMAVKGIGITANKSGKSQILIVNLNDGGTLVLGENGMTSVKPLTATLGSGEIGISFSSVEIGAALNLSDSAETTFNTAMYTWTGEDASLELEAGDAGGSITVSGNITGDGSLIKAGDGSLILSGGANVLTHTIDLQKGELALSGTFDVTALASGGGEAKYVDGEVDGNGFLSHGALTAHVVDIGDDATVSADGTFTVNGAAGTFDTNTGNAIFAAGATYTTLYVNVANTAEGLAHAIETAGAQGAEIAEVRLANSTTLNLNSADAVLPLLTVAEGADATLNVTENSSITKVAGAAEGHTLTVNGTGGTTLTIGSAGADSLASAGDLVIGEGATVLLQGNNTNFTGNLVINGTLKVGPGVNANDGTNALGTDTIATTATRSITVNSTGVLDFNGKPDTKYAYVLAGGKITNTGATIPEGKAQMSGLKLTDDSTVEANAAHEFWLLSSGYNPNTADLQGNTLVKTGDGQFGFRTTTITAGTLEAQAGSIRFNASNTVADMLLTGGTFTGAVDVKDDISVTTRTTADMSAALNITEAGKVVTFSVDADQTHTQSGAVSGSGSIVKQGAGTLVLSAANTLTSVTLTEGAIKASVAGALGSSATTVAAGTTLEMTVGNAVSGTGSVSNAGNVLIHNTLTSGSITGGTLTLAGDFPTTGDILEDVDDQDTGNGFSQGGSIKVYDPTKAELSVTEIKHGDSTYHMDDLEDGAITLSGADWTTYQLKVDNDSQPTIQAIMDYADAKSGGTGTLQHIVVTGEGMSLVDDSTEFKTSMLGGDKLNSLMLALVNGASLKMDADLATSLQFGSNSGDAAAEIVLEKNAAIDGAIWAYTAAGGTADLTVKGAYTLSLSELDLTHGKVTLQDGAKVAVATIDPEGGDSIVVKDTAELSLANGSISIKAVNAAKDATLSTETGATYDIGSADYTIENARITLSYSDAAHNFGHVVAGDVALVNAGTASVNDTNAANTAYAALHAQNGNIYLANKAAVTVADLTVDSDRTVGSQLGNNVAITVTDTAEFGSDAKLGAALTMAANSTLDTANPVALQNHALSLAGGINISDTLWSTLTALEAEHSTNLFTGVSALTLAGAEYTEDVDLKDIFNHTSLKANKFTLGYKDGNVVITKNLENNRYWKGGDGTWNTTATNLWTDEETGGSDAPFVNGYNAHFTKDGGLITLGEDITAANVYVSGSGANFAFKDGGHTLTVTNLFEVDGASMATVAFGLNGDNLKLSAKNGAQLVLTANSSVKGVEIGSGSTLDINSANLTVADSLVNSGTLKAGTLTLQKGTEAGGKATAAALNLTAGQSYTFGDLKVGTLSGASANLTITAGNTLTVDANSTVAGLTLGDDATVAGDGTLNTGGVSLLGDATVSGKLVTGTLAGTGTLKIEGGELSAAVLGSGVDLATTGTTTITSTALRIALNGTVDNAATGTVTFVGSFDVGNCTTVDGTATYVGGGISDNGFKQAQKIVSVISAGTAVDDNAKLYYKGTEIGKMDDNGQVTFQGATDYTTFYVNKSGSTEKVSTALSGFDPAPGAYVLANGTTLQVDGNNSVAMSQITLATDAAANLLIDRGSTVTTDGTAKNLTLMGAGTLAVDAGKATTGVTLANTGWTGTVSFTEAQLTTLDGAWNNRSTVSLTGVTGSLGGTAVGAAVVLNKGTGDWGFGQTVDGTQSVTLNGAITGEGNLGVKGGSSTSTFTLGGNIDGWTGNFVAGSANATLKLTGTDKNINGSVNGSNLALVVETNATLKSDSSVARVDASSGSLKVDDGKTLTVTDSILPNNIKLGAGASIVAAFMGGTEYGYQDGTIANGTDSDQNVTIDNANITVTGATLATGGATAFTVDNKLVDAKLLVAETLTAAVALNNVQDSLQVEDGLDIGTGGSLKVANGVAKQTLNIGSGTTLTLANGTTLDADVAIGSGATVKLNYNMGGTPVATTLNGGALTLANSLTLSGNLYDKMAAFTDADDNTVLDLFQGVGALTLGGSAYSGEVNATQYFTNLTNLSELGDFTLLYNYSSEVVSIRFNITQARTLTWNGTEGDSTWEVGEGTAENWLDPTQEPTHFNAGDTAKFTADAAYKDVTIDAVSTETRDITVTGAEAQYGFVVGSGTSTLDVTNLMRVTEGAALAKKGEGDLVLNLNAALAVDGSTLAVEKGSLYIGGVSAKLDLKNATVKIAEDGTLVAGTITGDAATTIAVDGLLQVSGGSIQSLDAGEDSTLSIADGTLAIAEDTTLYGLVNTGTLDLGTHDLTIADSTGEGGNVTAGTLHLAEAGSSFGDLKVNTIHYAYDKEGAGALDYVAVGTITSNGADKVTLDMTDVRGNGGSLAPIQRTSSEITYMLVYAKGQTLDAASFMLDAATQEALVQNGLIREGAGLTVSDDSASLLLTIGGQDLTWYTSSDTTEWGYKVMNGDAIAHGGNTLNGVQHVVVDESRTIDVTDVAVDELLRVRNITGTADQTITFTGGRSNTVALIATEDTSSDVNVAAEHILLGIGLPETDDIDPTAYDADLHVGSVKLTDAAMVVTNGATFSVDRLNGDDDSVVSGAVVIEGQGGAYRGGYAGADITVAEDAEATLYAGESLRLHGEGMVKLMYTKSTEIDGVDADGMTLILNNPNASIIGSTLTLEDESGLTNGTLVFGMSAVESAKHIGSIQAPQVIEGSLVLGDGTTVVVNQDDLADSGIAMVVNNGGAYSNLTLAYIGNEETYTRNVDLRGDLYGKYYKNARIRDGKLLVDMRDDFYQDLAKATTPNGRAGAGMLDDALRELNPQAYDDTWSGDLATVMTALETGAIPQGSADRVAAAMSGASAAAMGAAWSHDVDRQLRAIRNRTTSMGVANCEVNEDMPYFNAWVNAEGDYSKLSSDGTLAGYKLSSWGGTLGFDVDFTPAFTAGLALTVMQGDFTAESAEAASGDLDRLYVTVFGRYTHRAWTHTLVATFGTADTKLKRTVNYGVGSYDANGDSDGRAFGIMYEAGYAKALDEDGSTCIQPMVNLSYRSTSLGGYTEKGGSDAALKVGEAKANVFTAAIGARLQSTIGTSAYNRASIFEGRVLVKGDAGDRDVAVNNAFTGVHATRKVKSAELGAFGVEVGAGVIIPLGESAGSLFLDATGEFRAKYTEINGTVGYRFNF